MTGCQAVDHLLRGEASPEALVHVLDGCPACGTTVSRALRVHRPQSALAVSPPALDRERVARRALAAAEWRAVERQATGALVEQLLRHPPGRRTTLVRNSWRYRFPTVVEALCDGSKDSLGRDPVEAAQLASLAVEAADGLPKAAFGEALVNDLRGRARVYLALALRKRSLYRESRDSLADATEILRRGTRDVAEWAWMLEIRGGLSARERRFDEALRDFRGALRCYRLAGKRDLVGRVYSRIARTWLDANEPERQARALAASTASASVAGGGRVALAIAHNLLQALIATGERRWAAELLAVAGPLWGVLASPTDRLAMRWLEARVTAASGDYGRAAEAFREVRDGYLEFGMAIDAAVSSLDWALAEVQRGEHATVRKIAGELLPVFESRQLSRESLAALQLFRQAAEERAATTRMIQAVARIVSRRRTR